MIILGLVLAIPEIPARLDSLVGVVGVILIFIGLILLALGVFGRPVGGKRYWY